MNLAKSATSTSKSLRTMKVIDQCDTDGDDDGFIHDGDDHPHDHDHGHEDGHQVMRMMMVMMMVITMM